MHQIFRELTKKEHLIFKRLDTPVKLQNFLETLPINFNETLYSPRKVLEKGTAHCFEGALFACAALLYHGKPAILLDLVTQHNDDSHVVALFKEKGKWGAISKTNHAVLRYRDLIYDSPRALAFSYFHEYFKDNGRKTLRSYAIFNLNRVKRNWIADEKGVLYIDRALNRTKHIPFLSKTTVKKLRKADPIEIKAGKLVVWKIKKPTRRLA